MGVTRLARGRGAGFEGRMTDRPSWRYRLYLLAYRTLLALGEPLVWRYFRRRAARDPAYGEHWCERQGESAAFDADVWVHAVSLGELRSAVPLIRELLSRDLRVVTTHMTPAGRGAAEDAFGDAIATGRLAVRYAPVDRARYWRRFFDTLQPRAGLVMEMEYWPVMTEVAARQGVPLWFANAQVPSKSFARMQRQARWFGHPVARAAGVFAKSERMAERFRTLGAKRVEVMGETRFDIAPPEAQLSAAEAVEWGRPVVTFASVVAGEEDVFAKAARALLGDPTPPRIVWVPRAPELFGATAERLRADGFNVALRSEAFDQDLSGSIAADMLVGDSMGEMFFYMAPASVVVVGGGFVEKGAHNVIEPLALGKPVVVGLHVWTIEYPGVEAEAAGVMTITEGAALADAIRAAMAGGGDAARAFHAANVGASARIAARIVEEMR